MNSFHYQYRSTLYLRAIYPMKYFALLVLIAFGLNQCSFITDDNKNQMIDEVQRIEISEREHGYSTFPTTVICTADSLDNFLDYILPQYAWNYKQVFIDSLINAQLDFQSENLVLFRQTETSGSNQLSLKKPYRVHESIVIELKRNIPSIGTDDMAFYCFAYRIKKEIKQVKFKIEKMEDVVLQFP